MPRLSIRMTTHVALCRFRSVRLVVPTPLASFSTDRLLSLLFRLIDSYPFFFDRSTLIPFCTDKSLPIISEHVTTHVSPRHHISLDYPFPRQLTSSDRSIRFHSCDFSIPIHSSLSTCRCSTVQVVSFDLSHRGVSCRFDRSLPTRSVLVA
jgi:hypothetical protein